MPVGRESRLEVPSEVRDFLLSLADDKHLMGQQHAEWIGVTPFLEEDLAFCSIGQDELGHAAMIYALLVGDDDRAIDQLAFGRSAEEYRSSHLVELATDDWSIAFARHWLFDLADRYRWEMLSESSLEPLREIAVKVEQEEFFHRAHADQILDVLLADDEGRARITAAVQTIAPLVQGIFALVVGGMRALELGVVSGCVIDKWPEFTAAVSERLGPIDWGDLPPQEARRARSADWQPLMDRMREVIDLDPEADW